MISRERIEAEIRFYEALQKRIRAEVKPLPKANVFFKQEHGRQRPYVWAKGREKYLGAEKAAFLQGALTRKEYERSLRMIDQNINALTVLRKGLRDINEVAPIGFSLPDRQLSRRELTEITERWAQARKIQNLPAETFVREGEDPPRTYKTSDGIYVKSKTELFIYEFLKSHGVVFIYERPVEINGKTFYPDFTIIRKSDGRLILWEHFGMMHLDWYRRNAQEKVYDYSCAGFWPLKNFIATYEFGKDDLDASEVERILHMMQIL